MKYIKLYEGFLMDVFLDVLVEYPSLEINSFPFRERVARLVKDEIDVYMYDILDEYQVDNDSDSKYIDYSIGDRPESLFKLVYRNIDVSGDKMDDFLRRYDNLCRIFKVEYGLEVLCYGYQIISGGGLVWPGVSRFDISKFKSGDYKKISTYRFKIILKDKDEEAHSKSTFLS